MKTPGQTASSLQQLLDRAIACHRQGQLAQAEALYQQILQVQPSHFDARHMLGVIRYQQGRAAEALELVETALKLNPGSARALSNRGLILYVLRQADVAPSDATRRGVQWLTDNQRASGRWFTHSLNWDSGHSISNGGTAYAVMALKAWELRK